MADGIVNEAIFSDARVLVTPEIVTIDGVSYAVQHITSVTVRELPRAAYYTGWALILVGIALALTGMHAMATVRRGELEGLSMVLLGAAISSMGGPMARTSARFSLVLGSASGDRQALESNDQDWLKRVLAAIEQAMRWWLFKGQK